MARPTSRADRRRASTSNSFATGSKPRPGTRPPPGPPCRTMSSRGHDSGMSKRSSGSPVRASAVTSRRTRSRHDELPVRRQRHTEARDPRPRGPSGRRQPRTPRHRRDPQRADRPSCRDDGRGPGRGGGPRDRRAVGGRTPVAPARGGLLGRAARCRVVGRQRRRRRRRGVGMAVRVGVVVFPGSNCDRDTVHALHLAGADPVVLWHEQATLEGVAAVVLPGGFAYGDYVRAGVIARFSPVMRAVTAFAGDGGLVLGICNGFQVLAEAGLVPGALLRNASLRFVGQEVAISAERLDTRFTHALAARGPLRMPVAHGEGRYYADDATLDSLEADGQVIFRYVAEDGEHAAPDDQANPNGSLRAIAG